MAVNCNVVVTDRNDEDYTLQAGPGSGLHFVVEDSGLVRIFNDEDRLVAAVNSQAWQCVELVPKKEQDSSD